MKKVEDERAGRVIMMEKERERRIPVHQNQANLALPFNHVLDTRVRAQKSVTVHNIFCETINFQDPFVERRFFQLLELNVSWRIKMEAYLRYDGQNKIPNRLTLILHRDHMSL